jgi:hypothetical protein
VDFQRQIVDIEKKMNAMNIEPEEKAGPIPQTTVKVEVDGS